MKKTIIIISILILLFPLVFGIKGGESWTYNFPYCEELKVNITANLTIDDGEYTVHNDCENISKDYLRCNCSNDFDFNISFAANAVNDYELFFNYKYLKEVKEESGSSSGGSGGGGGIVITGLKEGSKTTTLNYGDVFAFYLEKQKHRIIILKVTDDYIKIKIFSKPIELTLKEGGIERLDFDDDGLFDFSVKLNEIKKFGGSFTFTIIDEVPEKQETKLKPKPIKTSKTKGEDGDKDDNEGIISDKKPIEEKNNTKFLIILLLFILTCCIVGFIIYRKKQKN